VVPRLLFVLTALAWCLLSPNLSAAADLEDSRILRVEQWLKAVLDHEPGAGDDSVVLVGSWPGSDLRTFWVDAAVLAQLTRDPKLSAFRVQLLDQRSSQRIAYAPHHLRRLKVLACAAAGIVTESPCLELKALADLDTELRRLADAAAASRIRGDGNYILRRGALLHSDTAMFSADPIEPLAPGATADPQRILMNISDGREIELGRGAMHWEIARVLLDAVAPGPDTMVRRWYRATAAWMQNRNYHDPVHLTRARGVFPNDADILFLSGCEREAYARPDIHAAARAAVVPRGITLDVRSEREELGQAEAFFRRALALNPDAPETRLRLGRVLLLRGRYKEAANELRLATASAGEDLLRYYGTLFLGAAEEGLGDYGRATAAYAKGAELYPAAQSPRLALSALARRRGDRRGAVTEIRRVFDLPVFPPARDDPWWTYHTAQARNADALLDELRQPFLEAGR
jgi:tetratricopeptide (TPR) repeat protein